MSLFSDWSERLRGLLFRRRAERLLDREMRFHLEREVEHRIGQGESRADARRGALLAFGGVERIKEEVRDARGTRPFEELLSDLRYSIRGLIGSPVFTLSAVVVLGLALGATTTVFTIAQRVLFAELPHPAADRLVRVYQGNPTGNRWALSVVDAQAILAQQQSFEAFGFVRPGEAALTGVGGAVQTRVASATTGFFDAVGARLASGRFPVAADEAIDAAPVVVISTPLATARFGTVEKALGATVAIDAIAHVVVGVLAERGEELAGIRASVWMPLKMPVPTRRGPFWLRGIGRLRSGTTFEAAQRDLAGISERIFPIWATSFRDQTARLTPVPLRETIVGTSAGQIYLFTGAVALVLLVAIANVATLMLVRTAGREQELSVRLALGAGRARLTRLLVADGLVLTSLAALVGWGLATIGTGAVRRLLPDLPRVQEVTLGWVQLLVAIGVALGVGILISAPAVVTGTAGRSSGSLRIDARRTGTDRRTGKIRAALVIAEFALALPLLVGAGLLMRSLIQLQRVDPGFDPKGLVAATITLPSSRYPGYPASQAFWRRLEQRAGEVPGLARVGLVGSLPPDEPSEVNNFDLIDKPVSAGTGEPVAPWVWVTPGYFGTMGIELLEGRMITEADSGTAPPVVLVSRAWARRYYPEGGVIGKTMVSGGCTSCPPTTVVGVVGDVRYQGLAGDGDAVYQGLPQTWSSTMRLVARTGSAAGPALQSIRELVRGLDAELPVEEITLQARLGDSLAVPARWSRVLGAFAVIAAILATLGVFGLMSYAVRQQRRELGVRLALGAAPGAITAMVVKRGIRYAAVGTAIGVVLAMITARWLEAFLFGVGATDPLTVVAVAAILLGAAAVACWVPGRQAARVEARVVLGE